MTEPSDQSEKPEYKSTLETKLRRWARKQIDLFSYARLAIGSRRRRRLPRIDVIVCSPGGVATTTLLTYLTKFSRTNSPKDLDGLKHVPSPEVLLGSRSFSGRILYIYGDPETILRSIDRRGWVRLQGAKLGSLSSVLLPMPMARRSFKRAVEQQIAAFKQSSDERLLCVEFDALWDQKREIARFLGLEEEFACGFPERQERHTPLGLGSGVRS